MASVTAAIHFGRSLPAILKNNANVDIVWLVVVNKSQLLCSAICFDCTVPKWGQLLMSLVLN
jgi:hypothetical protein